MWSYKYASSPNSSVFKRAQLCIANIQEQNGHRVHIPWGGILVIRDELIVMVRMQPQPARAAEVRHLADANASLERRDVTGEYLLTSRHIPERNPLCERMHVHADVMHARVRFHF